jgi:hypothetical protein
MSMSWYATSAARFGVSGRITTNFVRGHGGRNRMVKELGKKYANVTRDSIELFKSMCIDCQRKRVRPMTITSSGHNSFISEMI